MHKCANEAVQAAFLAICGAQQRLDLNLGDGTREARKAAIRQVHGKFRVVCTRCVPGQAEETVDKAQCAIQQPSESGAELPLNERGIKLQRRILIPHMRRYLAAEQRSKACVRYQKDIGAAVWRKNRVGVRVGRTVARLFDCAAQADIAR